MIRAAGRYSGFASLITCSELEPFEYKLLIHVTLRVSSKSFGTGFHAALLLWPTNRYDFGVPFCNLVWYRSRMLRYCFLMASTWSRSTSLTSPKESIEWLIR